jgi:beta-glucanase (GH16 family)
VHTQSFNHMIGTQKTRGLKTERVYETFHVYAMEWFPGRIDFFIDEFKFFSFLNTGNGYPEWPFDKKFHLVMNIAVGGNWGGQKGIDESIFPGTMEIDFVRVFQKK